jgi:hypothetical protein
MAELLLLPAFPTVGSMYASKATAAIAAAVLRYRVCSGGSGGILARPELEDGRKNAFLFSFFFQQPKAAAVIE